MPKVLLTPMAVEAASVRRLCPRDSLAPPAAIPPTALQVYVAPSADGGAFGIVIVMGGDAERDGAARHLSDAAARVKLRRDAVLYLGATTLSPLQATLSATLIAFDMLTAHGGVAPAILRICHSPAAAALAGTWASPRSASQLLGGVLRCMRDARVRRCHVWLAGFGAHRPYPWGERAAVRVHSPPIARPMGFGAPCLVLTYLFVPKVPKVPARKGPSGLAQNPDPIGWVQGGKGVLSSIHRTAHHTSHRPTHTMVRSSSASQLHCPHQRDAHSPLTMCSHAPLKLELTRCRARSHSGFDAHGVLLHGRRCRTHAPSLSLAFSPT